MGWAFHRQIVVKTKKEHSCHLCRLTIPRGAHSTYTAGCYEGSFFSVYSHNECESEWENQCATCDEPEEFDSSYFFYDGGIDKWRNWIRLIYDTP